MFLRNFTVHTKSIWRHIPEDGILQGVCFFVYTRFT
jgi:hypothetical protein